MATATASKSAPTRTETATNALRSLARESGAEARLPSFVQLRESLGVSVVTLNKALATLEAHQVLYRRHGVGIFVSPHVKRRMVGIVVSPHLAAFEPDAVAEESPIWRVLVGYLKTHLGTAGHDFAVQVLTGESATDVPVYADFARAVTEARVHGVLGIGMTQAAIHFFAGNRVPVVTFAGAGEHRVELDNSALIASATRTLLEAGCRRLALVLPGTDNGISDAALACGVSAIAASAHLRAFADTLCTVGAPLLPRFLLDGNFLAQSGYTSIAPTALWYLGYRVGQSLFAGSDRPDGVVCTNDVVASGLLTAAQEAGVGIGSQVLLATHANTTLSTLTPWAGRIIRLAVSPDEIARRMLVKLDRLMAGETDPVPRERYLATVLSPTAPTESEPF